MFQIRDGVLDELIVFYAAPNSYLTIQYRDAVHRRKCDTK